MPDSNSGLDPVILGKLRTMAIAGQPPSMLFDHLKTELRNQFHIGTALLYFREAFQLPLSAVKPIAAFTRNEGRSIVDSVGFDEMLGNVIQEHRHEWGAI